MEDYLSGIPMPIACESLASWIQRVCQVYDLTYDRFHETFGTLANVDPDLCLTRTQIKPVAQLCGLPESGFTMIENCFCRFAEQPSLRKLLLTQSTRLPLYRYCAECWSTDPVPFLRLEWRFRHWTYCPRHRTALKKICPSCKKLLAMHRAVLGGTTNPPPVLNLATCLYCRTDMRSAVHSPHVAENDPTLSTKIAFQQAIVSAVLHGHFHIEPFDQKRDLDQLMILMNGVGLEAPDQKTSRILNQFGHDDLATLEWVLTRALQGAKWLRPGHPRRRHLPRTSFQFWQGHEFANFK